MPLTPSQTDSPNPLHSELGHDLFTCFGVVVGDPDGKVVRVFGTQSGDQHVPSNPQGAFVCAGLKQHLKLCKYRTQENCAVVGNGELRRPTCLPEVLIAAPEESEVGNFRPSHRCSRWDSSRAKVKGIGTLVCSCGIERPAHNLIAVIVLDSPSLLGTIVKTAGEEGHVVITQVGPPGCYSPQ